MESKPRQGGGLVQSWRNPNGDYSHAFLRLVLSNEPDNYPGVLIISDIVQHNVQIFIVKSLLKELPNLLKNFEDEIVAYWCLETNEKECNNIRTGLTEHPVFVG